MKQLVALILVLFASHAWAQPPNYGYLRKSVENQNPKDTTPNEERVFVSFNYADSIIVRYRKGLTLREVVDQSKQKHKAVQIQILRNREGKTRAVFVQGEVRPNDKATFVIEPQDVVLLQEPYTPQ